MTEKDVLAAIREQLTVLLYPHAAKALGISRNLAYDAAKKGELQTIRIGGAIRVPTAPLRKLLGIEPASVEVVSGKAA